MPSRKRPAAAPPPTGVAAENRVAGNMPYEFLSSDENAEVVQGLFERDPEPAALRRALKDHFGRDVTPAVVSRLVSDCCVRKRDGYPVRCVWQDRGQGFG